METLNAKLIALANAHKPLAQAKSARRVGSLERMASFYEGKLPIVNEKSSSMFRDFIGAIKYAITAIKMYRKLCVALNELAEEANKS